MHFIEPNPCYVNDLYELSLNSPKCTPEQTEIASFSTVLPLKKNEIIAALRELKLFLNTQSYLSFEKLTGGDVNPPILVSIQKDSSLIPKYILKHEPNCSWGEKRMKAMHEMRSDGFDQLPQILHDSKGNYTVKLGEAFFSCIEYLEPDFNQVNSIEQMFMLASSFHSYSKKSSLTDELRLRGLDTYSNKSSSHVAPELTKWDPSLFETEAWKNCVKCAHYFTSQPFLKIYNSLPTQLIHGDITPHNTILSKGKYLIIDLDKVRTDVRLLDFATFSGWSYLERYLSLTEEGKLFSCIQTCYGTLEEIEQKYYHLFVLFGRCAVLEWSLRELKQALCDKNVEVEHQFGNILKGTIKEINEIYNRIPQIKEIIH